MEKTQTVNDFYTMDSVIRRVRNVNNNPYTNNLTHEQQLNDINFLCDSYDVMKNSVIEVMLRFPNVASYIKQLENSQNIANNNQSMSTFVGQPIFIDISGRQTGKTTRLIDSVLGRLAQDERSVIFCHSNNMANYIIDKIREEIISRDIFGKFMHHRCDTRLEVRNRDTIYIKVTPYNNQQLLSFAMEPNCLCYYDEFDFYIDDINPILLKKSMGYYCSTPVGGETRADIEICRRRLMKRFSDVVESPILSTIQRLRKFNRWRRTDSPETFRDLVISAKQIGLDIDFVCDYVENKEM